MIIRSSEDTKHLVGALAHYRSKRGISQNKLSKQMGMADHSVLSRLESRGTNSLDLLARYAEALGVSLELNFHTEEESVHGAH